jgi:ketosteroid isomerase-like protein
MSPSTLDMSPSTLDTVRDAFTSICQQFQKSFNQGDVEGLASLYLEDAKILPPNMDMIEGKDTIQTFWQGALDMGIKSYTAEMIEVESSGNLGFFVGTYTLYGDGNQVINKGKFLTVLKNIDGKWKIYRDIFNSSIPLEEK